MEQSARPAAPRILSVGQCGFDHQSISGYLADRFNAQVEEADGIDDARQAMRSARFSLVLVNRVLDQDGSSGLDLIRAFKEDPDTAAVPMMLVSDHPEAQQAARNLGALPGFGKAELHLQRDLRANQALCSRDDRWPDRPRGLARWMTSRRRPRGEGAGRATLPAGAEGGIPSLRAAWPGAMGQNRRSELTVAGAGSDRASRPAVPPESRCGA